jgi:uncharacterized protein (TIGR03545 family)
MKFIKHLVKGIMILILLIVVVIIGLFLFRNQIATAIIEKSGAAIFGAKVEVDNVYLKPFELHISWDKFQVTDRKNTWQNLFETGKCEFFLTFKPLLDKKVIIENMELSHLQFNTKRKTDGKLPPKAKKPPKEKEPSKLMMLVKKNLEEEKSKIPIFNPKQLEKKINVDAILAELNFQTPAKADSVKKIAETRYAFWKDKIDDNNYEKEVRDIKTQVNTLDIKAIDNIIELEKQLTTAQNVYNKSQKLWSDFNSDKKELEQDLNTLKHLKDDIPDWIKNDYQRALALAQLPDFSVENIALILFGDRVTGGLLQVMDAIERSRELAAQKEKPVKEVKPEKMPHLPSFWIKNIAVSLSTKDDLQLNGKVTNVSNNQKRTKKPMEFQLKGQKENLGNIILNAIFDYRTDASQEKFSLDVSQVPIRNLKLAKFELLPEKLTSGEAKLSSSLNFTEQEITSSIQFAAEQIKFDYTSQPKMNPELTRIARSITEAIDKITFDVDMKQTDSRFHLKLNSNLDNLIAQQMKRIISEEIERAKLELRRKVEKELAKYQQEFDKLVAEKQKELESEIAKITKQVDEQKEMVLAKKREIEQKIDTEKKKYEEKLQQEIDKQKEKLQQEADKQKEKLEDELKKKLWG